MSSLITRCFSALKCFSNHDEAFVDAQSPSPLRPAPALPDALRPSRQTTTHPAAMAGRRPAPPIGVGGSRDAAIGPRSGTESPKLSEKEMAIIIKTGSFYRSSHNAHIGFSYYDIHRNYHNQTKPSELRFILPLDVQLS
jgi:hypothetical protein